MCNANAGVISHNRKWNDVTLTCTYTCDRYRFIWRWKRGRSTSDSPNSYQRNTVLVLDLFYSPPTLKQMLLTLRATLVVFRCRFRSVDCAYKESNGCAKISNYMLPNHKVRLPLISNGAAGLPSRLHPCSFVWMNARLLHTVAVCKHLICFIGQFIEH